MELEKQRAMALAILRNIVEEKLKEGEDLEDGAEEFIEEFGDDGTKIYSNVELREFVYALADQVPPPVVESADKV